MDNGPNTRIAFTENQRKAVTTLGRNLCVTAGAGSGKTTVLVERFLYLMERGGFDLHEIVAITFTEKAANQMKEKIRARIREKIAHSKEAERDAWSRRYREVGSAWIHTIHGLCTRILKENALEAGLDPHFLTLDETESLLFMEQTVREFITERLNQDAEAMIRILSAYGLSSTRSMLMQLLEEREKASSWAEYYLRHSAEEILRSLRKHAEEKIRPLLTALGELSCGDPDDKMERMRRHVLSLLSETPLGADPLESVLSAVNLRMGSRKAWGRDRLDRVKKILAEIRDRTKRCLSLYDEARALQEISLLSALLEEFQLLRERYREKKALQGLADFDDLLILARDLLAGNTGVRDRCRREIRTLLMDELQDTDPLQMEIVDHLCGEEPGRIFAVGDPRQSIYRFRGADVRVFQNFEDRTERSDRGDRIPLDTNFRSQSEILGFINRLFSGIFPAAEGEGREIPFQGLRPHKGSVPSTHYVEAFLLPTDPEVKRPADACREEEASWIAWRIRTMVENREPRILEGPNGKRAAAYGDIALLFRAMTRVKIYETALRKAGIPFTVVSGSGFFEKQEVQDVLHMLRLLLYPEDEEALAGILRSPCVGVRDDTLFWMSRGRPLRQGLEHAEEIPEIDATEREILLRMRERMAGLRSLRDRVTLPELIGRFLDETGYPALLLTDPVAGEQRYANLRKLMDLARRFSARSFFSLSDFLGYVEELREREAREAESPIDEEGRDAVRILSIHKAKGLEFPVVFLPDLGRKPGGGPPPVIIRSDLGIGIRIPDNRGSLQDSSIRVSILEQERIEEAAEEKRLFYVAATRAKDFLVLSGQISFPSGEQTDSAVPMDWIRNVLGLTEENCLRDIPYGERKIRVFTPPVPPAQDTGSEETWVDRYPALLEGKDAGLPAEASPGHLLARASRFPTPRPPRHLSVTRLVQFLTCPRGYELAALQGISEPPRRGGEGGGGRALGSLVHRVLQHWDLAPASLELRLDREVHRTPLSLSERAGVRERALRLLKTFAAMDLVDELRKSPMVLREVPFLIDVDGTRVEGAIDLLYRTGRGRFRLIDFKTDAVSAGEVPAKAEAYRLQIAAYAVAVHRLFGEPVDAALVFLHPGRMHPMGIDPHAAAAEIASLVRELRNTDVFAENKEQCPHCGYFGTLCRAAEADAGSLPWSGRS